MAIPKIALTFFVCLGSRNIGINQKTVVNVVSFKPSKEVIPEVESKSCVVLVRYQKSR